MSRIGIADIGRDAKYPDSGAGWVAMALSLVVSVSFGSRVHRIERHVHAVRRRHLGLVVPNEPRGRPRHCSGPMYTLQVKPGRVS